MSVLVSQISMNNSSESERMRQVQTPVIPKIAELVRQNPGTISLGQGVVWYGPPPLAFERARKFLEQPEHKYQSVEGIPLLLEQIELKLRIENGIGLDSTTRVMVTAGANMAFKNAILTVTSPGDEVILFTPYYFNHEMAVRIAGCKPVLVDTDSAFLPRLEQLEAALTARTRAVVTISPNNPAGVVYPEELLQRINQLCRARGLFHIHDEAYEYFVYRGAKHFSPGSIPEAGGHTISLFSLSKAYGFASWRIGYMAYPGFLQNALKKIQDTLLICPPVISQYAAAGALEAGSEYCRIFIQQIAGVRELVLNELEELRGRCHLTESSGAFYLWLRLDSSEDPFCLAERLIKEHGVALIPGAAFGVERGCNLRLAYGALQLDTARDAMRRFIRGAKLILG
jgi:aspartate/methionine/tyrosine aminotransferase